MPLLMMLMLVLSSSSSVARAAEPAQPVEFAVELLDGSRFDSREVRGQWLVVNFWATWCTPCLKEIPELSALHDAHADITVIGLAWEDIEPEAMQRFLRVTPASYPIAIIDVYDPPEAFTAPRGLPLTLVLDPEGHQVERFVGAVTRASLEAFIEARRG